MKKIVLAVLVFCGLGAMADDLVIQSLNNEGQLVFSSIPYVSGYQIEQKSTLSDTWGTLLNVAPSDTAGSITSTVPMTAISGFFRVVAIARPIPEGMVEILAGTNSGTDPDYGAYSITVETFCMDEKEVSKFQWLTVRDWAVNNGYTFNTGSGKAFSHPVVEVSWYDCVKWCNARSEMEGKDPCYTVDGLIYKTGQSEPDTDFSANGYRLPTTIEWEYAARGGLQDSRFPWGDTITHSQANYYSEETRPFDISPTRDYHHTYDVGEWPFTAPVGSFAPNSFGLYDMTGNVWEWCNDAPSETYHNIKSGSWYDEAETTTCGALYYAESIATSVTFGFRTVCR